MKFFHLPGISLSFLKLGFIIKLFAGITVGLIYTYYYTDRLTADTFKFFDDSKILHSAIYENPLNYLKMLTGIGASSPGLQHYYDSMTNWYDTFSPFNDNRTMIRLNAFLRLFSFGYYYVHVTVVCFLSFVGIIAIVKTFSREYPGLNKEIFLIFLLLPSVLFWGSGLLKDALVFFTFGLVLLFFDRMIRETKFKSAQLFIFIVALCLLMITKFQVFLISVPLLIAWGISSKFKFNALYTFAGFSLLFFSVVLLTSHMLPDWDVIKLLVEKQSAFFELVDTTDAGSAISIPVLEPNLTNFIIKAPIGFFNCLTRPFITDSGAFLNTISAIENVFILLLGAFCVLKFRIRNVKNKILPVFCLFYTLYSFTLIGMITPILGAMVRYKAQALPFMVVLFIIIAQPAVQKVIEKFIPKSIS